MQLSGWIQLVLYVGILLLITKPLGVYLIQVLDGKGRTFLDPILQPLERLTYRILGVDPRKEQDWKHYTVAMLIFSGLSVLFTYIILRIQNHLPFNPQGFAALPEHLSFNTAISFATNTNWQSYSGESTMSYFSQMVGLVVHNFSSAAVGIAIAAALVRGIAGNGIGTLGNFWVDLVRIHYYLLLPICVVYALFLISQGMIQNFKPYDSVPLREKQTIQVQKTDDKGNPVNDKDGKPVMIDHVVDSQSVLEGPMASQVAIKMLGTNGGGFANANAAHPFENPTPLSNFIQMLSIFSIGSALTYYLGRMVKNQKHGWSIWLAMMLLFLIGTVICWHYEAVGNPLMTQAGVDPADGNMEGKETRFGIFNSALFATITTDASCGAVNAMHDSFTPLGGLIPLFNIQLGEVVIGGVGSGLYGILIFVFTAVFIAGLMVGRTPEYLGKKIQAYEVKMSMLVLLLLSICVLAPTAWAVLSQWGPADSTNAPTNGTNNNGPHGFSEILYAYSSVTGNNGSAFAGLSTNAPWYNTTLGIVMFASRFLMIVPIMAIAGSLGQKRLLPAGPGSFPVSGITFILLLIGTVLLVGALNFLPALALGPIVEHFLMHAGQTF